MFMKKIYTILVCLCILAGFVACEKDKEFVLTKLMVQNETITPSYGSATIDCSFKADATISEAFVQYSLSSSFAKYDVAKMTEEKGKYVALLTDLVDNTTYYIRYAVSNKYSSVVTTEVKAFTTDKQPTSDPSNPSDPSDPSKPAITLPTVNTTVTTQITATTAVAGGNVTNDGGAEITERGVCIATISNPTTANTKILAGSGTGEFTCDITGLQEGTKYYVRAYAVNSVGTAYGDEISFTTALPITLATVTTASITQITETTAVIGGNVTSDGGAEVTERGVVYSTNPNPVITNLNNTIRPCGSGIGAFTYNMTGLQSGTTYYVRAYAKNDAGTAYGEELVFTTESVLSEPTGTENGYGYVDLGLSVKWATMNVGATKPEEYGDYFAWGETSTKSTYNWSTYTLCKGSSSTLTKYNTNSSYGTVDNKTQLELSDDAARANWGGSWRMPTDAEMTELRSNCTWTWTTQNGVNGYKVTSKSNGNSIFFPAAGSRSGSSLDYAGSSGLYWSSSLYTDYPNLAWYMSVKSGYVDRHYYHRYRGHAVRPVCP